ncbi:alpha-1,2-fucosyltransferase [Caldifermentibacillus hisashii]|uniref:alpha-1,2-fucosyltransferase n=1 Tax=Caldifermentibacillus hisashii TaxID=996558 RepID=UPI0030D646A1
MNIIRVSGGIGNQMFQYALYLAFKIKGKDVKLDLSFYNTNSIHNNYELEKVFGIKADIATKREVNTLAYYGDSKIVKIKKRILGLKKTHYIEKKFEYNPNIFNMDGFYLQGYWQSYKYFMEYKKEVLEQFKFPKLKDEKNFDIAKKIRESNSVSIHVRRGDYVNHPLYEGICDLNYYKEAIRRIQKIKGNNLTYFIFSNDINWARNNLILPDSYYIDWNTNEDSFIDMQLMAMCKANIIANSTFSWWAAYMNSHKNNVVICPKKWFNNKDMKTDDLLLDEWIKI